MRRSVLQMSNATENDGDDHAMLNLQVVDDAFGAHSDFYRDCLRVSADATSREIQNAFLAKRRELFRKLEQGLDCNKQLDAVVLAVRILGDAELRAQYDDIRKERMEGAPCSHSDQTQEHLKPSSENNCASRSDSLQLDQGMHFPAIEAVKTSFDYEIHNYSTYNSYTQRAPKRRARIVTPEPISKVDDATVYTYDDTVTIDQTLDQTIDDMTILSGETHLAPRTLLDRIADECIGALEDTSKSLEEVFSVFTLQDEEIDAVAKRIQKAKRQMNLGL